MAANLDIYQLVDTAIYEGQKCLNVYFYQRNSVVVTVSASDLATRFIADVLPFVGDIQVPELLHTEIKVTNLFDSADSIVVGISEPGTNGPADTDQMPIFNAVSFTLNQDNGSIRAGAKRYAGLQELGCTNGVITESALITDLGDLAEALADALQVGIVDTFFPIVVKRILLGSAYVLPDNLGDAVIGGITDAVFNAIVTSQNSRKIGRGE